MQSSYLTQKCYKSPRNPNLHQLTKPQMMGSTTSFVRLFEFMKNYKFGFSTHFRTREPWVLLRWKKIGIEELLVPVIFLNLKRIHRFHEKSSSFMGSYLFSKKLENCGVYMSEFLFSSEPWLWILRTTLITSGGSVPVSNNCWTLAFNKYRPNLSWV